MSHSYILKLVNNDLKLYLDYMTEIYNEIKKCY